MCHTISTNVSSSSLMSFVSGSLLSTINDLPLPLAPPPLSTPTTPPRPYNVSVPPGQVKCAPFPSPKINPILGSNSLTAPFIIFLNIFIPSHTVVKTGWKLSALNVLSESFSHINYLSYKNRKKQFYEVCF